MAGLRPVRLAGAAVLLVIAVLEWRSRTVPAGREIPPSVIRYSDWNRFAGKDGASARWLASYCAEKRLSCIIDMTAEPVLCGFDEASTSEMMASTIARSRTIAEEKCTGYRWRESGASLVFEPKFATRGTLERKIPGYDSGAPVPASGVLLELAKVGHLENTAMNAGEGIKPRDSAPAHVRLPAGSVKEALEAAGRVFPETVWWISLNRHGHIYGALQWVPPTAKMQLPAR